MSFINVCTLVTDVGCNLASIRNFPSETNIANPNGNFPEEEAYILVIVRRKSHQSLQIIHIQFWKIQVHEGFEKKLSKTSCEGFTQIQHIIVSPHGYDLHQ